jgi:hypothetical protein
VADNLAVGRLDPARLPELVDSLDLSRDGRRVGVRADAVAAGTEPATILREWRSLLGWHGSTER